MNPPSGYSETDSRESRSDCLAWAAAGAMLIGGVIAQAQTITPADRCSTSSGGTVTCTGALEDGDSVKVDDQDTGTYTGLVIEKLTTDIDTTDKNGIEFTATNDSNNEIDIDIDTGEFGITTNGRNSRGIKLDYATGVSDNIAVDIKTGGITTHGRASHGIEFDSERGSDITIDIDTGASGITTNGTISTGVDVDYEGDRNLTFTLTGNVTSVQDGGIRIGGGTSGNKTVTVTGDIKAKRIGLYVSSGTNGGSVNVTFTGDIGSADSYGIQARSQPTEAVPGITNDVTVTANGRISSYSSGIIAEATHSINIDMTGDITVVGSGNPGINTSTEGDNGEINITLRGGTIRSYTGHGILFFATGDSQINKLLVYNDVTIDGGRGDVTVQSRSEDGSDDTIENYGTLRTPGIIDLGEGNDAFENMAGATFESGNSVILRGGRDSSSQNSHIFKQCGQFVAGRSERSADNHPVRRIQELHGDRRRQEIRHLHRHDRFDRERQAHSPRR